ncbi:MAG TPA: acetyltransferase [Actinomycetota bacterium]|nr:acetyltransferase [Actinomycetota bacterium]
MTTSRVVVVGAGGHAREVLQILLACRQIGLDVEPVGFVDEATWPDGATLDGVPILGGLEWFESAGQPAPEAVCAVGTPSVCRSLATRVGARGVRFASAISPSALVAGTARIGRGAMVFPNVVVGPGALIGDHVALNVGVTVSHDTVVGSFSGIGPGAHLAGNVTLGTECFVGMGANVIQGVSIGDGSVIGAGATVLDDVPSGMTAAGVPARVIGPASPMPLDRRRPSPRVRT